MPIDLSLLDDVRWRGRPVVGGRAQALLAALALAGRAVNAERLVAEVWGDEEPANPAKALQVLVSRTRAVVGAEMLATEGNGYRLETPPDRIDAGRLHGLAGRARTLLVEDPAAAAAAAEEALELGTGALPPEGGGPLADVRRRAARDLASARVVLARARSRSGDHAPALSGLEEAVRAHPEDEGLLADLLRSEAAVRGTGAALGRFERHRSDLRDRLGADVGPELRRVHRELLALDSPVRVGVRFDATPLLGRDDDLRRVRAMLAAFRVVSILGPGGLGKTRLAHAVAREAPQPVVRFVELVGVTAPEDLVGEVGSALGVRDSVTGRGTLTPRQRADVRARIAQQLDLAPTLLVLDNCEHLVEAVADLVAYLTATTRELRVLTTTRSPLAIAAERVYQLPQLGTGDAVELFRDRATAARPGVRLDEGDVLAVVTRLDGLPLAIELAAAKVRVMSPAEIARRLEDRFALLRGGDRSAPSRHQTLLAVIDWSWNLLGERERRALRRLSAFPDGFALDAAEEVLGGGALGALGDIEELVEQSLLTVVETADGVRYRMLETVREFGRMRLDSAGETAEARAAVRVWALGYADRHGVRLYSPEQADAMDRLRSEETNLADVLREALADPDPEAVVVLFSALGGYWSICGDHSRSIVLTPAVAAVLTGWTPPPRLLDRTRVALGIALLNTVIVSSEQIGPLTRLLSVLGADSANPFVRALVTVLLATVSDPENGCDKMAADPDPLIRRIALHWLSHGRENSGDPAGAIEAARAALELADDDVGPWHRAVLHAQLAGLYANSGDSASASEHAAEALPVLERLGAVDDAIQIRAVLATGALVEGRRDEAARMVDELGALASHGTYGEVLSIAVSRAELALFDGDTAEGLRQHREAAEKLRNLRLPGTPDEQTPWSVVGEAVALSAFAQHGEGDDGTDLFESLRARTSIAFSPTHSFMDYPVAGMVLAALGIWGLLKEALPAEEAVRLLALADRFAYSRFTPTMHWPVLSAHAERIAPGVLPRIKAEYGERRGPDLLAEARAILERMIRPRLHLARVRTDRQRGEHRDDDHTADDRPADLGRHGPVVEQVPHRGDDVRHRVDLHERLQPAGQRLGRDEGVGQEGEREHDHHRDPLDALRRPRHRAQPREDPRQRPARDHGERDAADAAEHAAAGTVADEQPGDERQHRSDEVTDQVGDHRPGQGGDPRDRQGLEAVEDPLVHVLPQLHPCGHADGQGSLGEDAGNQYRKVIRHTAGDRAAEDEREHRREQQRLDQDVEELLRLAPHLLHGPPRHRQGLDPGLLKRTAGRRAVDHGCRVDAPGVENGRGHGGHRAASIWGSSSAPWPVSARKTSSSVGLATLTEEMPRPASRRPIRTSAARSGSGRETLSRPDSGVRTGSSPSIRRTTFAASTVSEPSARPSCRVESPTWVLSASGVSSATFRPRSITATRSASWSASSRYWVVRRIVEPSVTS
ncbi:hypothetical protein GCM10010439_70460 [Actinocorallia aurantiaca]|uniref:OmpR/PhoB-type domain-containing protein n=1 Tax=Actinocorallia aurantiaca TaxID=46204 RepID=A0ABN3USK6_9ACTN